MASASRGRRVLEIPVLMPTSALPMMSNSTAATGNAWDPLEDLLDACLPVGGTANSSALDAALADFLDG
jgi:hypothetical protein